MAASLRKTFPLLRKTSRIPVLVGLLWLLAGGSLWASDQEGGSLSAIPPGQEDRLAEALTPPDDLLPGDVKLSDIRIERHAVQVTFIDRAENKKFQLLPIKTPGWSACRTLQHLKLCSEHGFPSWTKSYLEWLRSDGRETRAAAAWTVVAERETPREKQARLPDFPAPIAAGLGCLILALLGFFLRFRRKDAPPVLSGLLAAGFLALATAFFTVRALGDGAVAAAIPVFLGVSLATFRVGGDRQERFSRRLKTRLHSLWQDAYRSGLAAFLAVLFLIVLQLSGAFPPVNWILDSVLGFFNRPWLSDSGIRAGLTWGYFIVLLLALAGAFVWVFKTDRKESLSLLPALATSLIGGLIPAWIWILPSSPAPGGVWLEYGPALWLMDVSLPAVDYRLGGGFVGALLLKIFAGTKGWTALNLFANLFCCTGLAVAARLIFRSHKAAFATALLWALYPAHPAFLVEGWWFFLGAGWLALAVGTHVHAVRNRSVPWLLLSLLCAQWAMETRVEGVLILPLFFVIQATWKPTTGRTGAWLALFCAFNLLRLATAYQTESAFGAGVWQRNLLGYAEILKSLAPWFLAALTAAWVLARRLHRAGTVLLAWLCGSLAFYLLAATAPSHREGYLLAVPAAILFGGLLAGNDTAKENSTTKTWRLFQHPAFRPVMALLLLFIAGWAGHDARVHWMKEYDRKTETAHAARDLIETLDAGTPILVNPAWRRLVAPKHPGPEEMRSRPKASDLPNLTPEKSVLACLGYEMDGVPYCCYYELGGASRADVHERGDCWPASLSGRDVRTAANRGRLQLYELYRTKEVTP